MTVVFADTSFYVAVLNPRDALHDRAKAAAAAHRGRVVTTDFVLTEVANFFSGVGLRSVFAQLVANLRNARDGDIIPATRQLWNQGLALYTARPDKEWSLTDCISFVVMAGARIPTR